LTTAAHRILVVDDEEMIRDSIVEFLDDNGYEGVAAVDGRDALAKLSATGPLPCLILLDLMMPVMDGKEFREQQLLNPGFAGIPVVVFSAYRDLAKTAHDLNAVGHLPKPVKLAELLQTVKRHCANDNTPA
jgi:two-component system, OmpR family, response regulator CpxR